MNEGSDPPSAGESGAQDVAAREAVAEELVAEEESDWEWRRKIRSNQHTHRIYKWVIGIIGMLIVVGGVVLLPLPGPGWVIIFVGLAVWASEFDWAQRLLKFARAKVRAWADWLEPKPLWVKALVALGTAALVGLVFYAMFLVSGVPSLLPDFAEDWIKGLPGQ